MPSLAKRDNVYLAQRRPVLLTGIKSMAFAPLPLGLVSMSQEGHVMGSNYCWKIHCEPVSQPVRGMGSVHCSGSAFHCYLRIPIVQWETQTWTMDNLLLDRKGLYERIRELPSCSWVIMCSDHDDPGMASGQDDTLHCSSLLTFTPPLLPTSSSSRDGKRGFSPRFH